MLCDTMGMVIHINPQNKKKKMTSIFSGPYYENVYCMDVGRGGAAKQQVCTAVAIISSFYRLRLSMLSIFESWQIAFLTSIYLEDDKYQFLLEFLSKHTLS